jgi:hypothetical protein
MPPTSAGMTNLLSLASFFRHGGLVPAIHVVPLPENAARISILHRIT